MHMLAMGEPGGILVIGDSFVDVLAGPLEALPTWGTNTVSPQPIVALPGGAALNVASGLQRLRGSTSLFSGIGQDAFGDLLRSHLAQLGVRLLEAPAEASKPTGVCICLSGTTDRSFCSHFGISDTFDASSLTQGALRDLGPRLCHVHVAGFYSCAALRKSLPKFLREARDSGLTTSLDTNNDATGQWGAMDGLWDEVLPLVDIFMPNELEARAIAGMPDREFGDILAALVSQVRGFVVVTQGADGAVLARKGEEPVYVAAPAVDVVDPLGAGDAFKAGFISRYVAGVHPVDALEYGVLTGSLCVTRRGACLRPPTAAQVCEFAKSMGCDAAAIKICGAACGRLGDAGGAEVGMSSLGSQQATPQT